MSNELAARILHKEIKKIVMKNMSKESLLKLRTIYPEITDCINKKLPSKWIWMEENIMRSW